MLSTDKEQLIYIDETGINDNETYDYGYAQRGQRLYAMKKAERSTRISIIAALDKKRLIAPFAFEGTLTRDIFETYLTRVLVPLLTPGKVIIMDNASFHKYGAIEKIITDAGCFLLYLPPYSPDLNPIEHYWASLKFKIKSIALKFSLSFIDAIESIFYLQPSI